MTDIWTGTADVENGETTVTVASGAALSDFNCTGGSIVAADGILYFVASRTDTLSFELTRPYAGADGTVQLEIWPINENTASLVNLAIVVERTRASIRVLDKNSQGLFFYLIGVTGNADPGPGNIGLDNADPTLATEAYIDYLDANETHRDVSGLLARFEVGTTIRLRSIGSTAYYEYDIAGTIDDETGYFRAALTYVKHSGIIGAGEAVAMSWIRSGKGLDADDGGTFAERDEHDLAPGGFIYLSNDGDGVGGTLTGSVLWFKNSASDADWSNGFPLTGPRGYRGWAPVMGLVNDGARRVLKVTGYVGGEGVPPTEGVGLYSSPGGLVPDPALATDTRGSVGLSAFEVAVLAGFGGNQAAWLASLVGASAYQVALANGFVGNQIAWLASLRGADGTGPGVLLTWDAGLVVGDPGSGNIRATGPDLGAALQLVVSKTNAAGDSIEPFLLSLADSTNSRKGQITLTRAGGNAQALSGLASITNGAGFVVLNLVPDSQAGASGFIDGNAIWFQFDRDGNAGAADLTSVVAATNSAPAKLAPVAADKFLIADSEDSNSGKGAVLGSLRDAIGTLAHGEAVKTDSYTIVAADVGKVMVANKATTMTFSFDPAATLGDDFAVAIKNIGAGLLILDPNGSELIDASVTKGMRQGESLLVIGNGTGFRTLFAGVAFGGDIGAGGAAGLVPAPAAGDAAAKKFLKADGTWQTAGDVSFAQMQSFYASLALEHAEDRLTGPVVAGPDGNGLFDGFNVLTYVNVAGATNLNSSVPGELRPTATSTDILAAQTMNTDNAGWGGYQARQRFLPNTLAVNGTAIRLTLTGPSTGTALAVSGLYIGHGVTTGNLYNFVGDQVPVTVGGSTSFVVPVGGVVVTDPIPYAFDKTKPFLAAFAMTAGDIRFKSAAGANYAFWSNNSGGGTPATTAPGGTWTAAGSLVLGPISRIETVTVNALTVTSQPLFLSQAPGWGRFLAFVDLVGAGANTDFVVSLSRNNGGAWGTVTLAQKYARPNGGVLLDSGIFDMTGLTSGTTGLWRIVTSNGKLPRALAAGIEFGVF